MHYFVSSEQTFVLAVLSKIVLVHPSPLLPPVPLLFFDFFPLPPFSLDLLPLFLLPFFLPFLPFIPFFLDLFFFPDRPFSAEDTEWWPASVAALVSGR
jgi:hypothetical protein